LNKNIIFFVLCKCICICICITLCACTPPPDIPPGAAAVAAEVNTRSSLRSNDEYAQLSNTLIGWGLKKEKSKPPVMPESISGLLKQYNGVYIAENADKTLYLTFDEGYENGYTAPILDILEASNVPAAFFITGDYIEREPELVKRMYDNGHIVGNHTVNHPSMPSIVSAAELVEEITALDNEFFALTGAHMRYMRPPRGEFSERTLAITMDLGYTSVFWSFAYADWETDKQKGAQHAYDQVMPYLHDGAIILLHAVSKDNAEALERIINDARGQGFEFKSLNEL